MSRLLRHLPVTACALLVASPSCDILAQRKPDLQRISLVDATDISGISCGPTGRAKAATYPSGELESCPLAVDQRIGRYLLPAATWIYLTEAGVLHAAWLPHDAWIQGISCKGTGFQGWSVQFHTTGMLKSCYPAIAMNLQGVPCRGASFFAELFGVTQVVLHENGLLASCSLREELVVNGAVVKKRQRIHLDRTGRILASH